MLITGSLGSLREPLFQSWATKNLREAGHLVDGFRGSWVQGSDHDPPIHPSLKRLPRNALPAKPLGQTLPQDQSVQSIKDPCTCIGFGHGVSRTAACSTPIDTALQRFRGGKQIGRLEGICVLCTAIHRAGMRGHATQACVCQNAPSPSTAEACSQHMK